MRGILAESDNGKGDVQIKRNGSHITGSSTLTLDPDRAVGTAKFSFDGNIFTDGFEGDLTQHLEIEKPSDPQGASAAQLMNSTTLHLKGRFTGKCSAEQQEAVKKWEDKTQAQDDPAEKAADQPAEETDDQAAKAAADAAAESDETN